MIRCPHCGSIRVGGSWHMRWLDSRRFMAECKACGFDWDATDEKNKEV